MKSANLHWKQKNMKSANLHWKQEKMKSASLYWKQEKMKSANLHWKQEKIGPFGVFRRRKGTADEIVMFFVVLRVPIFLELPRLDAELLLIWTLLKVSIILAMISCSGIRFIIISMNIADRWYHKFEDLHQEHTAGVFRSHRQCDLCRALEKC